MKNILLKVTLVAAVVFSAASCRKGYLDTRPSDAISPDLVYGTIAAVNSSQTSSYNSLFAFAGGNGNTGHDNYGQKAIDLSNDLMGNDMVVNTAGYGWFNADYQYTEWLNATGTRRSDKTWSFYYDIIKQVNLLLDNASDPTKVGNATVADIERVRGECLTVRAWAYFNLINNFQQTYKGNESKPGVPLVLSAKTTTAVGRGKVSDVYTQIIADLTLAETLLTGKTRPAKTNVDISVTRGVRARVALVMEDWPTAASYANKAKVGYAPMPSATYQTRSAFSTISNSEWMWGSLITTAQATIYASFFSHIDATQAGYAGLGGQKKIPKALYDLIPATDVRKKVFAAPGTGTTMIPDYTQLKHEVPVSGSWAADYLYMRGSEMYLIEAEALARQGQDAAARLVLNALIQARNPAYTADGFAGPALVSEILLQRRIELWGEGFSLFDIKRTKAGLNRATGAGNHGAPNYNPVVYTLPDASSLFLMRIPQREIDNNPALTAADQNP
ncbi:MAG: RagB/SusD family nutrient uptake outer membrane protein [Chitinophagaceae bacterium]